MQTAQCPAYTDMAHMDSCGANGATQITMCLWETMGNQQLVIHNIPSAVQD